MNLLDKCTKNEVMLIKQAGIQVENKNYTNEELKICETKIVDYIMSHSSKNGEISKLQEQYNSIFRRICAK